MLAFSFRAKTQKAKIITDRIYAESVDEAWSKLESQDYMWVD